MQEIKVHVTGYADSDAQERGELAWELQEDLRRLSIEDVSGRPLEQPEGAKGSALDWAQLVVTLAGSLPPLVTAVRAWLGRHPGASITLEVDGDRLTMSDATNRERQELVATWMARHGG